MVGNAGKPVQIWSVSPGGGGPLKWHLESGACRHCAALSDSLHAIIESFSNRYPERLTCTGSRDTSKGHMTEHPPICTFWSPKHFYVHGPPIRVGKGLLTVA